MTTIGHTADLRNITGLTPLANDPKAWGSLVSKAEYLSQYGQVKAWEVQLESQQLTEPALEQLAQAMAILSKHPLFSELEYFAIRYPTVPDKSRLTIGINQEKWRPYYQLLQVLDRFTGAINKALHCKITTAVTFPQQWQLERKGQIYQYVAQSATEAREWLSYALRLRDHCNSRLGLVVENNSLYNPQLHSFHPIGLFPTELKGWQHLGCDLALDVPAAMLSVWYRNDYRYDGPVAVADAQPYPATVAQFSDLKPSVLRASGAHHDGDLVGTPLAIGVPGDDVDWGYWMTHLRDSTSEHPMTVFVDLGLGVDQRLWSQAQASAQYLIGMLPSTGLQSR